MKKYNCFFLSILFLLILVSCKSNKKNYLYLDNQWEYSLENQENYSPIPIEKLSNLSSLINSHKGYIWLRTNVFIPKSYTSQEIALYVGIIEIADEVYINNHFLGKTGFFPPYEFSQGSTPSSFLLPQEYIKYGDINTITIRIWVNGYGKIASTPFISNYETVINHQMQQNFIKSKLYLMSSYFMMLIAAIYFFLYVLRRKDHANLSFSRLNFCSAFYLLPVYFGEYSIIYNNGYSFLLFQKIFNGIAAVTSTYFAISFVRDFFDRKDTKTIRIFRYSNIFLSIFIIMSARDITEFIKILNIIFAIMGLHLIYAVKIIIDAIKQKDRKVFILLLGFSPIIITLLLMTLSHFIFKTDFYAFIIILSWICTLLFFLGILVINFVKMANQVEFVNTNLEKIVDDRTAELASANSLLEETNTKLQFETNRAQKEFELASIVQQSFYKAELPVFSDWDFDYFFKPLAGVSGDLYDFFYNDNQLLGLGIFDVSGHGIASGLVTMLVKNIIEQEFYAGLNDSLDDVISLINSRVITEKGNIENYLTGILIRINGNKIELVNAGHPKAILYNSQKKQCSYIDSDNHEQCGVIGIPDFPVNVDVIEFEMNSGDELILYTDGITELENSKHEFFGKERLLSSISKHSGLSLKYQVDAIKDDLFTFSEQKPVNDDLTYLIIKKK